MDSCHKDTVIRKVFLRQITNTSFDETPGHIIHRWIETTSHWNALSARNATKTTAKTICCGHGASQCHCWNKGGCRRNNPCYFTERILSRVQDANKYGVTSHTPKSKVVIWGSFLTITGWTQQMYRDHTNAKSKENTATIVFHRSHCTSYFHGIIDSFSWINYFMCNIFPNITVDVLHDTV